MWESHLVGTLTQDSISILYMVRAVAFRGQDINAVDLAYLVKRELTRVEYPLGDVKIHLYEYRAVWSLKAYRTRSISVERTLHPSSACSYICTTVHYLRNIDNAQTINIYILLPGWQQFCPTKYIGGYTWVLTCNQS